LKGEEEEMKNSLQDFILEIECVKKVQLLPVEPYVKMRRI